MLTSSDLPTLTADGYTFEGWMISGTSSIVTSGTYKVTENVTLVAKWKESTISSYSVKHYLQKTTCDGYDLDTTESLSGEIGKATSVSAKTYKGFTAKEITQETIARDGSTVVCVYYDRNTITLTFDTDGGSQVEAISGIYGTSVTVPENPTKDDYVFTGWSVSDGTITELPSTFPSEDTTYTAVWKVFFYGNAASAANYIKNLTEDETVCVTGELTEELLSDIASAIKSSSYKVTLDLSGTTGLLTIPDFEFDDCINLVGITIPESVTSIGGYAFWNCTSLKSVTIPKSVNCIMCFAFENCTSLTTVIAYRSTQISDDAFKGCTSFNGVTFLKDTSISASVPLIAMLKTCLL